MPRRLEVSMFKLRVSLMDELKALASSSLTDHPRVEFIVPQKILLEHVECRNHRHILCPRINLLKKSLCTLIVNLKNLSETVRAGHLRFTDSRDELTASDDAILPKGI